MTALIARCPRSQGKLLHADETCWNWQRMPECEAVLIRAVPPGSGVPRGHAITVRLFVFASLVNDNGWDSNGIRSEAPVNLSRIKLQDHPVQGVFFSGEI